MNPNTHSAGPRTGVSTGPPGQPPEQPASMPAELPPELPDVLPAELAEGSADRLAAGLAALTAAVDHLAGQQLDRLPDHVLAERVLQLRRLLDRLEGQWLQTLAAVDAGGAAGADHGIQAPSTASWLRNRFHLGAGTATTSVRTARALFRGPLTQTATALLAGQVSAAHASVVAAGTEELPPHTAIDAEPVLLEAAQRLDPPRLRRVIGHLQQVADPRAPTPAPNGNSSGGGCG